MKLPEKTKYISKGINTMGLTGISVLWAVMLDLITPWWLILAVLCITAGYGSEVRNTEAK
jgi:hypothetical protein